MLMLPNMYRIAGGLLPGVLHVASRVVSKQALSLLCEHSDVMATRPTGWALLSSHTVQEAHDLALIAHIAAINSSVPFLHFFDGWRVSHEVNSIDTIPDDSIKRIFPYAKAEEFRHRCLNPNHPYQRGIAQSQDIYMQNCIVHQPFYEATPKIVEDAMTALYRETGRLYHLFDYAGHPEADRVVVLMGAGAPTVEETANYLNMQGEKVGVIKVHLFRPFSVEHLQRAIPKTCKKICVLDRVREDGAPGEPLYLDVAASLHSLHSPIEVIGGQYGVGGKDFTPAMAKAVYDNLKSTTPKQRFTIGVNDDLCHTSLEYGAPIKTLGDDVKQCIFWGYGSDGTVGSSQEAVKLITKNTPLNAQTYSVFDAHKSGGLTVSHMRFGAKPITSEYLVQDANYVSCSNSTYVRKFDMLGNIRESGTFVLNSPWNTVEELEKNLPNSMKRDIATKKLEFYNIDATSVAQKVGLKQRVNVVMSRVFFHLSNILPQGQVADLLENDVRTKYAKKGQEVIDMNINALRQSLDYLVKIDYPKSWATLPDDPERTWPEGTPDFVKHMYPALYSEGDKLPVSSFVSGGVQPPATSKYEKRGIASQVPVWDPETCTQCNQCSVMCPHACIRPFLADDKEIATAPASYQSVPASGDGIDHLKFTIQVSPKDCTGCEVCANTCPTKSLSMKPYREVVDAQSANWDYAVSLVNKGNLIDRNTVRGSQFQPALFEFPGACAGCGETQGVKLLTQLFGERLMVANAMGCSRVWGGTFCSNPYGLNAKGQGPAWGSSLFEDNAEFGFGLMLSTLVRREKLSKEINSVLQNNSIPKSAELKSVLEQWEGVKQDPKACSELYDKARSLLDKEKDNHPELASLSVNIDVMPKITHWCIGGDGWAYDIGYGGLDHVIASGRDINVMVLDTEMYANTGGQQSKATQMGAVAKFAAGGKPLFKKDLGKIAMGYRNVYVASICIGADMRQAVKALTEAESYDGPSLILNYTPCQQHGMPAKWGMSHLTEEEKKAVQTGYWPLYRYDPRRIEQGKNPFQLDSKKVTKDVYEFLEGENRFSILKRNHPETAAKLNAELKTELERRHQERVRMAMSDSELLKYLQKQQKN